MWFLIKGTFWFALVLVVLSFLSTPDRSQTMPGIEIGNTIAAATGAYQYIAGLCVEKPDVCLHGAETFAALSERAKAGALVAYQLLDRHLSGASPAVTEAEAGHGAEAEPRHASPDTVTTGTVNGSAGEHIPVPRPKPL